MMSGLRIGKCSCGAELTSPYSSDVNAFLEAHKVVHAEGYKDTELAQSQSESEKFFAHLNNGEICLVPEFVNAQTFMPKTIRIIISPKADERDKNNGN
jgi:hypothetical protein